MWKRENVKKRKYGNVKKEKMWKRENVKKRKYEKEKKSKSQNEKKEIFKGMILSEVILVNFFKTLRFVYNILHLWDMWNIGYLEHRLKNTKYHHLD